MIANFDSEALPVGWALSIARKSSMKLLFVTSTGWALGSEATNDNEELGLSMIGQTLPCEASSILAKLFPNTLNRRSTATLLGMNSMYVYTRNLRIALRSDGP